MLHQTFLMTVVVNQELKSSRFNQSAIFFSQTKRTVTLNLWKKWTWWKNKNAISKSRSLVYLWIILRLNLFSSVYKNRRQHPIFFKELSLSSKPVICGSKNPTFLPYASWIHPILTLTEYSSLAVEIARICRSSQRPLTSELCVLCPLPARWKRPKKWDAPSRTCPLPRAQVSAQAGKILSLRPHRWSRPSGASNYDAGVVQLNHPSFF